jgi:hypothetical protein
MRNRLDKRLFQSAESKELRAVDLGLRQYCEGKHASVRTHVCLYRSDLDALTNFIKDFKKRTGRRLTRSFILREGYSRFITYLEGLLVKAERGELHAKQRETAQPQAVPKRRKA